MSLLDDFRADAIRRIAVTTELRNTTRPGTVYVGDNFTVHLHVHNTDPVLAFNNVTLYVTVKQYATHNAIEPRPQPFDLPPGATRELDYVGFTATGTCDHWVNKQQNPFKPPNWEWENNRELFAEATITADLDMATLLKSLQNTVGLPGEIDLPAGQRPPQPRSEIAVTA